MNYPETALVAVEQAARRMARLGGEALAGTLSDRELRNLLADTARTLAGTVEDLHRELYPPEPVPEGGVGIDGQSPTDAVVAWVKAQGLEAVAQVRRAWVWMDGKGSVPEEKELIVRSAGFRFSEKRSAWFHTCGVESKGTGKTKPFSTMHGVSSIATYEAGHHRPDPSWLVTKQAKAKRRAALKSGSPAPAWGN